MLVVYGQHAPAGHVHPERGCVIHVFNDDGSGISLSKRTQTDGDSGCEQEFGIQCVPFEQMSAVLRSGAIGCMF